MASYWLEKYTQLLGDAQSLRTDALLNACWMRGLKTPSLPLCNDRVSLSSRFGTTVLLSYKQTNTGTLLLIWHQHQSLKSVRACLAANTHGVKIVSVLEMSMNFVGFPKRLLAPAQTVQW